MNKKMIYFLSILLLILLACVLIFFPKKASLKNQTVNISVLLNGENNDDWRSMKMGMDQASKDFKAELHVVSNHRATSSQMGIIDREAKNSNAMIIDSALSDRYIQYLQTQLPLVMINDTNRKQENILSITIPNQQMGQAIASMIPETVECVYIVMPSVLSTQIQERKQGILDIYDNTVTEISFSNLSNDMFAKKTAIIALDTTTMEKIIADFSNFFQSNTNFFLYGIGYTDSLLNALEENIITSLIVLQDYNVGYASIEMAVNAIQHKPIKEASISFACIDSSSMYEKENEALLFPFIQ